MTFIQKKPTQIAYSVDKWLQSQWRRDTRFYTLTMKQNLFGEWIVTKTWGSAVNRGFGKSKDLNCPNYYAALTTYVKLQERREKRGYKRVDLNQNSTRPSINNSDISN